MRTAVLLTILLTLPNCSLANPAADAAAAIAIAKARSAPPSTASRSFDSRSGSLHPGQGGDGVSTFQWQSYPAAFTAARKTDRKILVLITGPGCAACVRLERESLTPAALAGFELAKFDAANEADAATIKALGIAYRPTLLVVDSATNAVVASFVGFMDEGKLKLRLDPWRAP